jgi:hypothetical protein
VSSAGKFIDRKLMMVPRIGGMGDGESLCTGMGNFSGLTNETVNIEGGDGVHAVSF